MTSAKLFVSFVDPRTGGEDSTLIVKCAVTDSFATVLKEWEAKYVAKTGRSVIPEFELGMVDAGGRKLKLSRSVADIIEDGEDGEVRVVASAVKAAVPSPTKDVPIAVVQQKSPAAAPQRKQRVSPVLKELLAQACSAAKQGSWAAADEVWKQCCAVDSTCVPALRSRAAVMMSNSAPGPAVSILRRVAEQYDEATVAFDDCLGKLESTSPQCPECEAELSLAWLGVDPDSGGDVQTVFQRNDIMTWLARCLFALNDVANAVALVNRVIAESDSHIPSLLLYATVCIALGRQDGAVQSLLRLIVLAPKHKAVRRTLAGVLGSPEGLAVLEDQLPFTTESAPALAFLANILKDFSKLKSSVTLFQAVCTLQPRMHCYVLNWVHALECDVRNQEAFDAIILHLSRCADASVGDVSNLDLLTVLRKVPPLDTVLASTGVGFSVTAPCHPRVSSPSSSAVPSSSDCEAMYAIEWRPADPPYARIVNLRDPTPYTEPTTVLKSYDSDSLDLLAIWFTAVKILHVAGALQFLPPLVALIERVRRGSVLHLTTIRNENAYYCCIAQLLQYHVDGIPAYAMPSGALPGCPPNPALLLPRVDAEPLFVCGDSHSLSPSWHTLSVNGTPRLLIPALVTGLKAWHLRPESDFYPKLNFERVMSTVPDGSSVVMLFCEIDCREGILVAVSRGRYTDLAHGIAVVVDLYVSTLLELVTKRGMKVFVHPVVPVLNETRPIVKAFNQQLQSAVVRLGKTTAHLKWLDFSPDLLTADGLQLLRVFELDGTHLCPKYLPLLAASIERAMGEK